MIEFNIIFKGFGHFLLRKFGKKKLEMEKEGNNKDIVIDNNNQRRNCKLLFILEEA